MPKEVLIRLNWVDPLWSVGVELYAQDQQSLWNKKVQVSAGLATMYRVAVRAVAAVAGLRMVGAIYRDFGENLAVP